MPSRAYLAFNIDSLLYGNVNEGHQWYTSLKCVRNLDTSCPHCSGNAKISIEEARKIATKNKGLCLSETYNGAHTKLKWQCEKKHEWYSTVDKVKNLAHYQPNGGGLPSAPDVAIFPSLNIISPFPAPAPAPRRTRRQSLRPRRRTSRHNEIPPVTRTGRPHARIMCEVAVSQGLINLEEKCERWMLQEYVRCVFAIKIFDKDPTRIVATNQFNRRMIARLYTRQTTPSPNHVAIIGQPGVYFEEWEFGTLDVNGNATACNGLGLPAYQINIPVQEVFWNPPIVGGIPSTAGYVITIPPGITANNFVIDLYQIQQVVLRNQSN
ncbi:20260_t:CDS:2 [Entrophospora sp. SA101]|nr:20260_t:CDS:2 [Entrophospora sp. SA101]